MPRICLISSWIVHIAWKVRYRQKDINMEFARPVTSIFVIMCLELNSWVMSKLKDPVLSISTTGICPNMSQRKTPFCHRKIMHNHITLIKIHHSTGVCGVLENGFFRGQLIIYSFIWIRKHFIDNKKFSLYKKEYFYGEIQRNEGCNAIWGLSSVTVFFYMNYVNLNFQTWIVYNYCTALKLKDAHLI